ncbi:TetR/AcrR family transcriptional regulator [Sphingobium sp. CR2-8]|uniref:TetR/AcrR family transcriptional regulator n=1 Tax=Sphingobium sp. CR2-8 TaxID=1306534 RepID=UPI002DBA9DF4|nr:TetR/AcrR family transcriptional regulator [Sphingobium sp. CR2-8]MEC3909387.1 TetR/AcrR family transcriptional regulator [Sphingobium sp. CR2-8]
MTKDRAPQVRRKLSARKQKTYVRLLKIAVDSLEKLGFDNVVIRDVAQEAEVSPATIYNVFGTKEAFLSAALELRTRTFIAENPVAEGVGLEGMEQTNRNLAQSSIGSNQLVRSVATMLAKDSSLFGVRHIYHDVYATCIAGMAHTGLLAPNTDANALAFLMMISHNASLNVWASGELGDDKLGVLLDLASYGHLMPFASEDFLAVLDERYAAKFKLIGDVDFNSFLMRDRIGPGGLDVAELARLDLGL